MEEIVALMHQLLLGNGVLIACCVFVCAELVKTLLPQFSRSWIPLAGALMGMILGILLPDFSSGQSLLVRMISGLCLGGAATGAFESMKCVKKQAK